MTTTTIRLTTPDEIVASVPYLLGFTPTESIVIIVLADRRVALTARIDLDDIYQQATVDAVLSAIKQAGGTSLLIIGYSVNEEHVDLATLRAMGVLTDDAVLHERIIVTDGRWYCDHGEGGDVATDDAALAGLEFAAIGKGYAASRDEVVAECSQDSSVAPAMTHALQAVLSDPTPDPEAMLTAVRNTLGWGEPPTLGDYALAGTLVMTPQYRDMVYKVIAPAMFTEETTLAVDAERLRLAGVSAGDVDGDGLTGQGQDNILARLLDWARSMPDDAGQPTVAVLTVAAVGFWYAGDGTRARTLIERILNSDSEPMQMTLTVFAALSQGVKAPR